jgi:hypothetical protein
MPPMLDRLRSRVVLPATLVAATLIVRYLFDTLAPSPYTSGVIHIRSSVMSWTLIAILALTAAVTVWRTGRVRSGVLAACVAALLGGIGSIVGTLVMLAIWHDPDTLRAWQSSGGLGEALIGVPALLMPISLVVGSASAAVSRVLTLSFGLMRQR